MTNEEMSYLFPPKPTSDTRLLDWMEEYQVAVSVVLKSNGPTVFRIYYCTRDGNATVNQIEGRTLRDAIIAGIKLTEGSGDGS